MVSIRVYCYLLVIFFIFQLHAQVSNANFINQATQEANNEDTGASTAGTGIFSQDTEDVIENRKMLKPVNVKLEANKKNGLAIESQETVKKRLTKTMSLMADYSDPGHHPPRHN